MKLITFIGLLASIAFASKTCQYGHCDTCSQATPAAPFCPNDWQVALQPTNSYGTIGGKICACNCCKVFDRNGRREVDVESCAQKKLNHQPMDGEVCSCNCDFQVGPRGEEGCQGNPGKVGEDGCKGGPGRDGKDGHHGKPGYAGYHGNNGGNQPDCLDGNDGSNGRRGVPGRDGEQGDAGNDGDDGDNGGNGRPGPQGPQGPNGRAGSRGGSGREGVNGKPGLRGARGALGPRGSHGSKGPAGARGEQGDEGRRGPQGAPGAQGSRGKNGTPGVQGPNGSDGATGADGLVGIAGANGKDSLMRGPQGEPGDQGANGYAGADAEWEWEFINAMIADSLWAKLQYDSEYCASDIDAVCECGKRDVPDVPKVVTRPPVIVTDPPTEPAKPVRDVIILIDGSDSISAKNWPIFRKWVSNFVGSFNNQELKDKYSMTSATVVVQYSSDGHLGDNNSGYIVKKRLLSELQKLKDDLTDQNGFVQMASGTDTYLALEFIVDELIPKKIDFIRPRHFEREAPHTRELILITNGLARDSTQGSASYSKRQYSNNALYDRLSQVFEHRFILGIGSEIDSNDDEIQALAGVEKTFWKLDDISGLEGGELLTDILTWLEQGDQYSGKFLKTDIQGENLQQFRQRILNSNSAVRSGSSSYSSGSSGSSGSSYSSSGSSWGFQKKVRGSNDSGQYRRYYN